MTDVLILCLVLACSPPTTASSQSKRVHLRLDSSEAEAVLAILDKRALQQQANGADWQRLLESTPYQTLKRREASMRRPFTDEQFQQFVATLDPERARLRRTLQEWQSADLDAVAQRPLRYLPADATIRADVYPVIKPQSNSFVFNVASAPVMFLYLDPQKSRAEFEHTVAHELHHIGLASLDAAYENKIKALPEGAQKAARWMGAFGEGLAVLAAAGSADVAPLADFPERDRILWDAQIDRFASDVDDLNQFFLDTIHGDLRNDAAAHEGSLFFGYRGPWYSVGYRMAVTIERRLGRSALVATLGDPRQFVARYNEAARADSARGNKLPTFSEEILQAVTGQPSR